MFIHSFESFTNQSSAFSRAKCSLCYDVIINDDDGYIEAYILKEEVLNYFDLYNKTKQCFNNYTFNDNGTSGLCENCKEVYDKGQAYFNQYILNNSTYYSVALNMCLDVRDKVRTKT